MYQIEILDNKDENNNFERKILLLVTDKKQEEVVLLSIRFSQQILFTKLY